MCSTTPMTSAKLFGAPFGPTCSRLPTAFSPGHARAASVSSMTIRVLLRRVVLVEDAPGEQPRAHRAEVARRHVAAVGRLALPVARRRLVVGERRERAAAGQRQLRREADLGRRRGWRGSAPPSAGAARAASARSEYFAIGSAMRNVSTPDGIEARADLLQRRRSCGSSARRRSAAPARAPSRRPSARRAAGPARADAEPVARSVRLRLMPAARRAGIRPNRSAVSALAPAAKSSAVPSI